MLFCGNDDAINRVKLHSFNEANLEAYVVLTFFELILNYITLIINKIEFLDYSLYTKEMDFFTRNCK